jgi:hypothetical protein
MGHAVVDKNCMDFPIIIFFLAGVLVNKNLAHFVPFEWIVPVDSRCDDADATATMCGARAT